MLCLQERKNAKIFQYVPRGTDSLSSITEADSGDETAPSSCSELESSFESFCG